MMGSSFMMWPVITRNLSSVRVRSQQEDRDWSRGQSLSQQEERDHCDKLFVYLNKLSIDIQTNFQHDQFKHWTLDICHHRIKTHSTLASCHEPTITIMSQKMFVCSDTLPQQRLIQHIFLYTLYFVCQVLFTLVFESAQNVSSKIKDNEKERALQNYTMNEHDNA